MPADPAPYQFGLPRISDPLTPTVVVRNTDALAQTNRTSTGVPPAAPQKGMIWYDEAGDRLAMWVEITAGNFQWVTLVEGISALITRARLLRKDFTTPAASWVFDHNLGHHVIFQAFDTSGNRLDALTEQNVTVNRVVVTHTDPTTGYILVLG